MMMGAVAAAMVLLPFVVLGDRAGHEIAHRLAAVVVGGVVSSTIFGLVVVPALYLRFGRPTEPDVLELLSQQAMAPATAGAPRATDNGHPIDVATTARRDKQ
jgi:hypothetical protein